MTKEEIAKCKVGDEVEYLAGLSADSRFRKFEGRIAIIRDSDSCKPYIEIPGETSPFGNKIWGTSWKRLKYIGKRQRQLTFIFTE
jgi:hypothetical protein